MADYHVELLHKKRLQNNGVERRIDDGAFHCAGGQCLRGQGLYVETEFSYGGTGGERFYEPA